MTDDENPSPIIAELARQRPGYAPVAEQSQQLPSHIAQRQGELERIADDLTFAERGPLALQQRATRSHRAKQRVAAYSDGGMPADELQDPRQTMLNGPSARQAEEANNAKLGLGILPDWMQPTPNPVADKISAGQSLIDSVGINYNLSSRQRAAIMAKVGSGISGLGGTPNITMPSGLSSRFKASDDVTRLGFSRGGKIKGPGTATSDSIPATTGSGEPIRVANGERIVSVEQDKALQRIAEMLNYKSVDAMFEALTGKPVGPTIKGGEMAAQDGYKPYSLLGNRSAGGSVQEVGDALPPAPTAPSQAPGDAIKGGDAGQVIDGVRYQATPKPASPLSMIAQGYGAVMNKILPITPDTDARLAQNRAGLDTIGETTATPAPHPVSVPASRPGAAILGDAQPIDNTPTAPLTTKDILPGGYIDRGASILAQRGANGRLNVANVGTEKLTDPGTQILDSSAGALRDQASNNPYWTPAAQLERMQRSRLQSEATDSSITDPGVKADGVKGAAILNAAQQTGAQAANQNAESQLRGAQTAEANQLLGLHKEYLDPRTAPARRDELHGIIQTISGKERQPANLQVTDVEEPIDPKQPLLGNRKVPFVFDPRTGQSRPMLQGSQPNDPTSQARAAIARGADPKAVNARLRAMNLPEVK